MSTNEKNIYTYIYVHKLIHFAVHQKLTQHCKSTTIFLKTTTIVIYGWLVCWLVGSSLLHAVFL